MSTDIALRQKETPLDLVAAAGQLTKIAKSSRDTYANYMKSFKRYCTEKSVKADFDAISGWLDTYDSSASKTIALAAIKAVLKSVYRGDARLAVLRQNLEDITVVKKIKSISRTQYLTKKEVDRLIKIAPKNISLMIEAFFWTALRCSELLNIELKHCILVGKVYEIKVVGKGSKENLVYLEKNFFNDCKKFFGGEKYLFCHGKPEKKFTRRFVSREISKAGEKIGKNISAHSMRHSAACFMRDVQKMSIDKISRALNHSDISITAGFYLHGAPTAEERGIVPKTKKRR